ncbi:S-layer homology domain-containing protein [Ruminiclostridium cellobioparum]|uniref:S-layer homology domain-containing protein n=1 Tax=Ruminiclostridium cellobioparum TaxID=29355 RepID=UPI00054E1268|nr:S-layer homology domain-containing protein [Ruminiclostridium cellobioparum]
MKQVFNKTISLVLTFALSFGLLPSAAFAAEGESKIQDSGTSKPALTIEISGVTDNGAALELTADQDGTVYYLIQEASKNEPDAEAIKNAESAAISAATPVTVDAKDLLSGTAYMAYGIVVTENALPGDSVATDSDAESPDRTAGGESVSSIASAGFTTRSVQVAPTVSFLTAQLTAEGADLTFEADQDGSYYCMVDETETAAPDAAALKAQSAGVAKASGTVTSGSAIAVSLIAELSTEKQYTAYLVAENAEGLLSEVQTLPVETLMLARGTLSAGTPNTSWYTPGAASYTINTADQLAGVSLLLSNATVAEGFAGKTITLTNDVDLSAYQSGDGWIPIGTSSYPFKGTFNGDGSTITGLSISYCSDYIGLFGTVDGGSVQNLKLDNVNINISSNASATGGIAGSISNNATIESCIVSGIIALPNGSGGAGGIVGSFNSSGATSTVRNCISTATVSCDQKAGGIAGTSFGVIENCYTTGTMTAGTDAIAKGAGGIVGVASKNSRTTGCAAMNSSVTANQAGRVIGRNITTVTPAPVISNNYASSNILVNGSVVSGGAADDVNGVPKNAADWLAAATWGSSGLNWDTDVWDIANGSLPSLKIFGAAPPASIIEITQQPESITNVLVGSISGSLSVAASVTPAGPLSYQWYQNTTDSNTGGTAVSGANGESFAIPTALTAGTYYYFCEVSAGSTSVRSNAARVNVSAVADKTAPTPGGAGAIQLESAASATPIVKLTWTKATDNLSAQNKLKYFVYRSTSNNIGTASECENNGILLNSGGTADIATHNLSNPEVDTTYYFNIVVQDESGNRAAYQPVLKNGIVFSTQPSGITVVQGFVSAALSAAATAEPSASVSYQWYVRTIDVYAVPSVDQISGATNPGYALPTTLTTGDYYYYCKASIDGGRIWAYSDKVKVTVLAEAATPTITGPTTMAVEEGYSATSTGTYAITGTHPTTVTQKSGDAKITWNDAEKRLDIAAGLAPGSYPVTLEAAHPSGKKGTLSFTLTVNPSPVTSVTIKTPPTKTSYKAGEVLDLTGLVVTLTKSVGDPEDVALANFSAKGITATPANGAVLAGGITAVTITTSNGKTASQPITVKYLQAAPGKPELQEKSATGVTLKTITGAQYRMDSGAWQDSPVFAGLLPNTVYNFYAYYPETGTHAASLVSDGLAVTTDMAALSGTVTISGTAKFGETLTADASLTATPNVALGALSYQWKRDDVNISGSTNKVYTLTVDDIGKSITVTVTAANCDGSVTSDATAPVAKLPQDAPSAPVLSNKTPVSVTLVSWAAMEYSKNGTTWQSSNSFTGLTPNTAYTFTMRLAATATHEASLSSPPLTVTTNKAALSGTLTTAGIAKYGSTIFANVSALSTTPAGADMGSLTYEWLRNDITISGVSGNSYTLTAEDIGKTISVTVSAANCDGSVTSAPTAAVEKESGPLAPSVTFSFDGANANRLMGATALMEYSLNGGTSWADCAADMELTAASITTSGIKVRVKGTATHLEGAVQTIAITKAAAPTGIGKTNETFVGNDGTLTGVSSLMEYKLSTATGYTAISGSTVTGLAAGTYHVRIKATGTVLASDNQELTIAAFVKSTPAASDLTYSLTAVNYDGNAKPLSVTAASGKNLGAITVKYDGSTTAPTNAGAYAVTVDIAGNAEYNTVIGLSLGNYTVNKIAYTGTKTLSVSVPTSGQTGATVTLPALPAGASYGVPVPFGSLVTDPPSIDGVTLTYVAHPSVSGNVSHIKIPVRGATNYNDYDITVTVTSTEKTPQAISYASTAIAKTYGDARFVNPLTQTTVNGLVTYASDDLTVATVNPATGEVSIVGAGSAVITATAAETSTHTKAEASYTVSVTKKALTLKADDKSMTKGAGLPIFTYTTAGLINGDTVTTAPTMSTATDGMAVGTFEITISGGVVTNAASYDITYIKGTLTVADRLFTATVTNGTGGGSYAEGATVTITANDRSGYTFTGWSGADVTFADTAAKTTTFTMPAKAVTVTANYRQNSSGGGSPSGGGFTPPATPQTKPNQPTAGTAPVTAVAGTNGTASASIPDKAITDAISKAQADAKAQGNASNGISVELNVTMPQGATSLTTTLSQSALNSLVSAGVTSLTINGSPVKVTFDLKALQEIQKQSNGVINVSIAPQAKLSTAAKAIIGTRPVYDLTVGYGSGKTVSNFGGGTATISVPYTPAKGEAIGGLYAVYVDAKGNATRIAGSAYDANSRSIIFTTTHFSVYGVGYTAPSAKFTDISTHWSKESIDYVVGRGLLSGTSKTTFAPNTAMTRGMLVTALGRLAGVEVKAYTQSSFTDVKADSAFGPYIEWAYKKGIVQGIGNQQFAPDRAITREEIAVIFANFAKATGYKLPVIREASTYADDSSIGSTYKTAVTAMQQAGIMMGETNNKFNPKSNATRAEVSAMLHRYIKLTIDPATAQGWALDDDGQYMYYKDGKALTGTQTIDGVKYFFETTGVLKTGWVKDGGNWRYYSGNKAAVGWLDISDKRYYFTKNGLMVSGKWLQIDGKWYYFNSDGSLAKDTKVDGYEVDKNGVRKTK